MISKRIKKLASFIDDDSYFLDVGCDHAYLSIYLAKERKIKSIASDISEESFKKAKANIIKYKVEDLVKVYNLPNLDALNHDINTIVISGMGGFQMINILKSNSLEYIKRIILSPHHDLDNLKEYMKLISFNLKKEETFQDKKHNYIMLLYERNT